VTETAGRIITHARLCSDARRYLAGYKQAVGPCPFLDDTGNCAIYAARPMACRALFATRPPDWCGVNLAELPEIELTSFLAGLDRAVVAYPTHYAAAPQQLAIDCERGLLFAMLSFAGFGLTGNLPLLVWLCGEPGFLRALDGGPDALRTHLAGCDADRPFLLQIETAGNLS
jgi:hypothetical protein